MHKAIQIRNEKARGCGFRKPGGVYLFSDGPGRYCGFLPIVLKTCPTCGQSMCPDVGKQNRGFSWIEDFGKLITSDTTDLFCAHPKAPEFCKGCPLGGAHKLKRVGLVWIGKEHYPTPRDFTREAEEMGVSRRLPMTQSTTLVTKQGKRKVPAIPRGFKVGETWVALAHSEAVKNPDPKPEVPAGLSGDALREAEAAREEWDEWLPGIFYMYMPERIEYVVRAEECNDAEFIEYLIERGITPVHVKRIGETDDMFEAADAERDPDEDEGEDDEAPIRKVVEKGRAKKGGKGRKK